MRLHHFAPCAAVLLLAACNRHPPEFDVPTEQEPAAAEAATAADTTTGATTGTAPAAARDAGEVGQVTVPADAVAVGSALGQDGRAAAPKSAYTLADTIHATASVGAAGPGSTAHVYWTFENGMTVKEEDKPATGAIVSFSLSAADGMKPGRYNVQIDLDGVPVGIADFVVQ